ncbi:MAG: nucleoid-structuring protein H-NS, partial [Kiritimatiellae bacterium]|nr:nucleoid-structuring protein H-NS [Kiritimatiellia bacterium]
LLLSFLKNPKFTLRPVLRGIQERYLPLRQKIEWGYIIPYMISGMLNEHPRTAIAWRSGDRPDDFLAFYDKLTTPEVLP